jgi:hypothetical protein
MNNETVECENIKTKETYPCNMVMSSCIVNYEMDFEIMLANKGDGIFNIRMDEYNANILYDWLNDYFGNT